MATGALSVVKIVSRGCLSAAGRVQRGRVSSWAETCRTSGCFHIEPRLFPHHEVKERRLPTFLVEQTVEQSPTENMKERCMHQAGRVLTHCCPSVVRSPEPQQHLGACGYRPADPTLNLLSQNLPFRRSPGDLHTHESLRSTALKNYQW